MLKSSLLKAFVINLLFQVKLARREEMKKWLYVKSILVLIAVVALLAGCAINQDNNSEEGILVLGISDSALMARTVVPDVKMEIAYYNVWLFGPTNPVPSASPDILVPNIPYGQSRGVPLKPGPYYIRVYAFNEDDVNIAYGDIDPAPVNITRGSIANVTITVRPFDGDGANGFLSVRVSWPVGLLGDSPAVDAYIMRAADPDDDPANPLDLYDPSITMSSSGTMNGSEYLSGAKTLNAGYYMFRVSLTDSWGTIVWQTIDVGRVIAGNTTEAEYDLAYAINQGLVVIDVGEDLQNPLTLGFNQDSVDLVDDPDPDLWDQIFETTVTLGVDSVITALVPALNGATDTYYWYWKGSAFPVSSTNSYTIVTPDPVEPEQVGDIYWLDLILERQEADGDIIFSSARVVVTIQ